ncbi:hypothetical protein RclHR1_00010037 [Rhizophagus clarus]|uniref:Sacsin/Nov domain-containing protein n=1 Tax=Rhizophagus clarus TaxID=94130 RepID=A0A2Z6Q183_9GLOM|nr:hypothetical protein RclHR1_00010037 [Rhizophagus clarus]GES75168.1 hypothetical protein GLOIN_2v1866993 [Rhizophagus clarus]
MSLDNFRSKVLSNTDGEERVEVNQRLLIDKILARYPSEFVVFRELMQNSDDAGSSTVQIIFETADNNYKAIRNLSNPSKRLSLDREMENKITRIIFKNNGFAFRVEDWNRLKKIAEGNPDEQKIGAFGVGFYSLFSVCEEPFVSSGGQGMAFYWRGNQLFVKQAQTGDDDKVWTTFLMDMREPLEFPDLENFARFLSNSLGFTGNLQDVLVYVNDILVMQVSKRIQDPNSINIASDFDTFSPQKIFNLTLANVRCVQLYIKRLVIPANMNVRQWILLPNDLQIEEASIFLRVASGNLDVNVNNEISSEMERVTKKKPPSKTTIQMIYTGIDEDGNYNVDIPPIFKDLLPYPGQGRIYIGFPTHQTTGCCSHLAARVIPTVDRESIDLVEKTLLIYNGEMLRLAGTLCRILYENEMAQIARFFNEKIINNTKNDEDIKYFRELLETWATHTLTHFTFKPSTPNAQVGIITESQFFNCSKNILPILSTNGVLPISNVRIPNPEMTGFIKTVPVVPQFMFDHCYTFFKKARDTMKLIKELTLQDVFLELSSRTLSEDEMIDLLKWWISYKSKGYIVRSTENTQFMQLARFGSKSQSLSTIHYFLNPTKIPLDIDVPVDVLPFTISKNLRKQDLEKWIGLSELSLINWARFIVKKSDLELDPTFAKKVIQILGEGFSNISQTDKEVIQQLFANKKCIPTKLGMKIPNEAYFKDVNLFPDLPIVDLEETTDLNNILELLGVRKVVELKLIFDRLVSQGNWDHMQLAKYLASMSSNLKQNEIRILKDKPIWPIENHSSRSNRDESKVSQRFIARSLHTPSNIHREFGLPLLDWKGEWASYSPEGKFIIGLGLQEHPTLMKILELAAYHQSRKIRGKALRYFINNFEEKYSEDYDPQVNIAFLPCSNRDTYAKPSECYINSECTVMKFYAINQDLRLKVERFGVRQHPSREELLKRLIEEPPQNENKAKAIFEYLASRQTDFTEDDLNSLINLNFIPTKKNSRSKTTTLTCPRNCFFTVQEDLKNFLSCIDFGSKANRFLRICGVKDEPTSTELAELLVRSSREVYNSLGDLEKYLNILRTIAFNFRTINKSSLIAEMKKSRILIGVKKNNNGASSLALGKEIFLNDNSAYQQVFDPLTAPVDNDHYMKILYNELGCRSLHDSVKEIVRPIGIRENNLEPNSQELQETIIERASLFYYEHPNTKKSIDWFNRLKVKEASYMETTYVLDGKTVIKRRATTACILQDALYVTTNPDSLDIADHIVKSIYVKYEWKDVFCVSVLLTAELSSLKRKGYPVDHILKQQNLRYAYQQSVVNNNNKIIAVTPESTRKLRSSLRDSIRSCNSNVGNINGINSQANVTIVNESQASYCDIIPGHLLSHVGTIRDIKLFDTKIYQPEIMSLSKTIQLNHFIDILRDLADVFELVPKVVHIFYDDSSNSIAFNRDGALFFNLRFYIALHEQECKLRPTNDVMTYWFMTFCHELAHNFVVHHSSEHEFYFSSFTETYMSSFIAMMKKRGIIW